MLLTLRKWLKSLFHFGLSTPLFGVVPRMIRRYMARGKIHLLEMTVMGNKPKAKGLTINAQSQQFQGKRRLSIGVYKSSAQGPK